jgi:hypothetical protein
MFPARSGCSSQYWSNASGLSRHFDSLCADHINAKWRTKSASEYHGLMKRATPLAPNASSANPLNALETSWIRTMRDIAQQRILSGPPM